MTLTHLTHDLTHRLRHLNAKADLIVLFLAGLVSATAMAPIYAIPVLFLTIPLYFFLLNKAYTTQAIFWRAWIFNFGYFVAGLYWVAAALFVDIANNWWAIPFAVAGLPFLMSFYPAVAAALWHRLAWKNTPRLIAFVVLWGLAEWVRGWAFTGFPWNLWGYTWTPLLAVLQGASLVGLYGMTFMTLLLCFVPIIWAQRQKGATVFGFVVAFLFAVMCAWGMGRLHHAATPESGAPLIRIVQPDIKQEAKWDAEKVRDNLIKTWSLTIKDTGRTPDIIVWPETTITLLNTYDVRLHEENVRNMIPPKGVLIAGIFDASLDDQGEPRFYNAVGMYDASGKRLDSYNKSHLVPFGEFLPYQDLWPVRPVAFRNGGITRGNGVDTINDRVLPYSPLICYEILFPGRVVRKDKRPSWILNVTNDAWYGNTSGPYQHLGITQARAVEEGLPVVRAANTGISAIIDPMGRIVTSLALNEQGVLEHPLPPALKPTLFARYGNNIFFALLGLFAFIAFVWQRRSIRTLDHVR